MKLTIFLPKLNWIVLFVGKINISRAVTQFWCVYFVMSALVNYDHIWTQPQKLECWSRTETKSVYLVAVFIECVLLNDFRLEASYLFIILTVTNRNWLREIKFDRSKCLNKVKYLFEQNSMRIICEANCSQFSKWTIVIIRFSTSWPTKKFELNWIHQITIIDNILKFKHQMTTFQVSSSIEWSKKNNKRFIDLSMKLNSITSSQLRKVSNKIPFCVHSK